MQAWEWALELRTELEEWWRSPAGQSFGRGWTKARSRSSSLDALAPIQEVEAWKLSVASPFYVTGEMVDLLEHAAETFPPTEFHHEDLPLDSGFVLLSRPLQFVDVHGKTYNWRAFSWALVGSDPEAAIGVHLTTYAHKDDDDEDRALLDAEAEARGIPYRFGTLSLLHETVWTFGRDYELLEGWKGGTILNENLEVTPDLIAGSISALRQVHAFLLLSWQRIAEPTATQASRPVRKRAGRLDPNRPIPDVRVVQLRRYRQPNDGEVDPDQRGREYSHRFIVGGHWRKQWYPSEQRHKPRWIAPYVKGPDDKPLVVKQTTYVLSR